jgi:hypothetical protein
MGLLEALMRETGSLTPPMMPCLLVHRWLILLHVDTSILFMNIFDISYNISYEYNDLRRD